LEPLATPEATPAPQVPTTAPSAAPALAAPAPVLEQVSVQEAVPAAPAGTPLKTYSGDFSDRIKTMGATTATILAAEQDATPRIPLSIPEVPKNRIAWYVAGGVVLLVMGIVGAYFAYSRYVASLSPVVVAPTVRTPILVDETEQVSGSSVELAKAIRQSVGKPLPPNGVRLIALGDDAATGQTVFAAVAVRAPGELLRNIDPANSMAGIVKTGADQSPFFLLAVTAYGPTFSGMLSWESHLQTDLDTLYPLVRGNVPVNATTTLATTTPVTPAGAKAGFRDEVVSNHDVRVYRDAAGRSVVLYGYWNPSTLIIARDPAAFTDIVARLATSRTR
ncbi:MAG: hypothetical protein WCT45_01185, partial [Candidatus Paceibacterota bacterium]